MSTNISFSCTYASF